MHSQTRTFEDLFRGNGRAAPGDRSPGGDGGAAGSLACATKSCDRSRLGGSAFCGLCEAAQRESLVVLNNGAMDRRAMAAGQRVAPADGIPAGGRSGR